MISSDQRILIEQNFDVPVSKIWNAITSKEEMKQWYFDLPEFRAETGFKFQFTGGPEDGIQYIHLCEVTAVIEGEKLTYSWCYKGYEGISYVSFQMMPHENGSLLKLQHEGITSFPKGNPDFAIANFEAGWKQIINSSLKEHLEKNLS